MSTKPSSKEDFALSQHMEDLQLRMQMLSKQDNYQIVQSISYPMKLLQRKSTLEQVSDNTIKFHIAESDRKANMDVIETNKVANKDEIRRLRDGNKEFRQKLVTLQKVCYFYWYCQPIIFF